MLNSTEEFTKTIEKSENILIIIPPSNSFDSISSSFALYFLLEKMNKSVRIYHSQGLPDRLSFLLQPSNLTDSLSGSRDFKLIFETKKNKIVNVKTEEKDDQYIIHVTPEKGSIDPKDFSFVPAEFKFDMLIISESPSLDSLGNTYYNNTDLFFEVPKINIDYHAGNDNYGQINLVENTASSISEILAELILDNYEKQVDRNIAQSLLTGIISATDSFQSPITSPRAMAIAARLMKHEADQPTIVRHLYRTKSLSFLKLWGRVMARLHWDEGKKIMWSLVSGEDFAQSHSDEKDIPYVVEEISKNFPQAVFCAVIYTSSKNETIGRIKINDEKEAKKLSKAYNLSPSNSVLEIKFEGMNLVESEKDLLNKL